MTGLVEGREAQRKASAHISQVGDFQGCHGQQKNHRRRPQQSRSTDGFLNKFTSSMVQENQAANYGLRKQRVAVGQV